jgi:Cu-Zn family superoxide dismutase
MKLIHLIFNSLLVASQSKILEAKLKPDAFNGKGTGIEAFVTFTQKSPTDEVKINVKVSGLAPGSIHGFHVHNARISDQNCTTGLGHWNPKNVSHGAPDAAVHHYGDLGNLVADAKGQVETVLSSKDMSLYEDERSPIGRGLVLHENPDDLGLTDNPLSKTVGNAGARLVCGNIAEEKVATPTDPIKPIGELGAKFAEVELTPDKYNGKGVGMTGSVVFYQPKPDQEVIIMVKFAGLAPGSTHGFHIHNARITDNNCTTGLGHWNPKNVTHGAPTAEIHHYGDLGNLVADDKGRVEVTLRSKDISFHEDERSPIARGIVLHENPDDMGLTDHPLSKTVGNAGARLLCGNIVGTSGTSSIIATTTAAPRSTSSSIPTTAPPATYSSAPIDTKPEEEKPYTDSPQQDSSPAAPTQPEGEYSAEQPSPSSTKPDSNSEDILYSAAEPIFSVLYLLGLTMLL